MLDSIQKEWSCLIWDGTNPAQITGNRHSPIQARAYPLRWNDLVMPHPNGGELLVPAGCIVCLRPWDSAVVVVGSIITPETMPGCGGGPPRPYPVWAIGKDLTAADIAQALQAVKKLLKEVPQFHDRFYRLQYDFQHDWSNSYQYYATPKTQPEPTKMPTATTTLAWPPETVYAIVSDETLSNIVYHPHNKNGRLARATRVNDAAADHLVVRVTDQILEMVPMGALLAQRPDGGFLVAVPDETLTRLQPLSYHGPTIGEPAIAEGIAVMERWLASRLDVANRLRAFTESLQSWETSPTSYYILEETATYRISWPQDVDGEIIYKNHDLTTNRAQMQKAMSELGWKFACGITETPQPEYKMYNMQSVASDPSKLAQYHRLEQKPTTQYEVLHHVTRIFSAAMARYLQDNRVSASDWHQDRFRAVGRLNLPAIIDEFQDVSGVTVLINQDTANTGIPKGIRVTIRLERNGNSVQSTEYTTVHSYV